MNTKECKIKEKKEHGISPAMNNICLACGKSLEDHNRTGITHTYYDTSLMNNPLFAAAWNSGDTARFDCDS